MTDDERVEMVARAIMPDAWRQNGRGGFTLVLWEEEQDRARRKARAVLAALDAAGLVIVPREPTNHIADKIDTRRIMLSGSDSDPMEYAAELWRAGVDAALSRPGERHLTGGITP